MTAPFDRMIAISEYIKAQLLAAGIADDKIVVRHLGVDTERFKPDVTRASVWRASMLSVLTK
jgi:hypothetical protein